MDQLEADNTSFTLSQDTITFRVNPKVYTLERVYAAAYVHLDTMWFLFDGDPDHEIILKATRKQPGMDLDLFAKKFLNEIISISNYFNQLETNKEIIQAILARALFSANPAATKEAQSQEIDKILSEVNANGTVK